MKHFSLTKFLSVVCFVLYSTSYFSLFSGVSLFQLLLQVKSKTKYFLLKKTPPKPPRKNPFKSVTDTSETWNYYHNILRSEVERDF